MDDSFVSGILSDDAAHAAVARRVSNTNQQAGAGSHHSSPVSVHQQRNSQRRIPSPQPPGSTNSLMSSTRSLPEHPPTQLHRPNASGGSPNSRDPNGGGGGNFVFPDRASASSVTSSDQRGGGRPFPGGGGGQQSQSQQQQQQQPSPSSNHSRDGSVSSQRSIKSYNNAGAGGAKRASDSPSSPPKNSLLVTSTSSVTGISKPPLSLRPFSSENESLADALAQLRQHSSTSSSRSHHGRGTTPTHNMQSGSEKRRGGGGGGLGDSSMSDPSFLPHGSTHSYSTVSETDGSSSPFLLERGSSTTSAGISSSNPPTTVTRQRPQTQRVGTGGNSSAGGGGASSVASSTNNRGPRTAGSYGSTVTTPVTAYGSATSVSSTPCNQTSLAYHDDLDGGPIGGGGSVGWQDRSEEHSLLGPGSDAASSNGTNTNNNSSSRRRGGPPSPGDWVVVDRLPDSPRGPPHRDMTLEFPTQRLSTNGMTRGGDQNQQERGGAGGGGGGYYQQPGDALDWDGYGGATAATRENYSEIPGDNEFYQYGAAGDYYQENNDDEDAEEDEQKSWEDVLGLLTRYSLLFINFMLNVSALLLMMAGFVTRENKAISLCTKCSHLTIGPIVVGGFLWLASVYGFSWIRQKNILLLLGYAASLIVVVLALVTMLGTAMIFDRENFESTHLLDNWELAVKNDPESICKLQKQFNCSGYHYGCCRTPFTEFNPPSHYNKTVVEFCFGTPNSISGIATIPSYAHKVCPVCPFTQINNTNVCTDKVYRVMRRNLVGFSVILALAVSLIILGLFLAGVLRKQRNSRFRIAPENRSFVRKSDD